MEFVSLAQLAEELNVIAASPLSLRGAGFLARHYEADFISRSNLKPSLEQTPQSLIADYVTFSGMGEPTLASNLGQAIELAKSILPLPVAVLTNSSLILRQDVREDLAKADVVVAKLDAHNQELFNQINRPIAGLLFADVVEGIKLFRREFKGKLCLQIMFIEANRNFAKEIAKIASSLSPDEVQLDTPLRPCAVKPLSPSEMASIKDEFTGLRNVVTVYEASRPEVTPLNLGETLRRRPKL
jgi:wyosine [tRNA(Phe)-imidazoG37] synthetase (radical SAM superfamily)